MGTILELNNVSKLYGSFAAVDRVSFKVSKGEIFGFVGPNGAGKSTTLKMICGLTNITSGQILIDGKPINKNFEQSMNKIGVFIESPEMYNYLSGLENLKIFANFYGKEAKSRIKYAVELVGLENRIKDKVGTYSLGMKQRLAIAQAMLNKPEILIFDEPTNGLDPNGIIEIRNIFKSLAKRYGIAIIISSHNLSELQQICDTIAIINKGKIISYQSMEAIQSTIRKNQRISLKVDYPHYAGSLLEQQFYIPCEVVGSCILFYADDTKLAHAMSFLIGKKLSIFGVDKVNKSLEELFVEIIKKDSNSTSIF